MKEVKKQITPQPPRGMRDHLPQPLLFRRKVIAALTHIFELHGFLPLETPALERLETLSGKYGEEGDKLMFLALKRGADLKRALPEAVSESNPARVLSDMGLRYDFTVSLARVMAQYGTQLPDPFKRYQIGPVWRADRPQLGRYREFTQCDVDIVNGRFPQSDAEIIQVVADGYHELQKQFQFPDWEIQINDRRLLGAFNLVCGNKPEQFANFCTALDKLDKIGGEGVRKEMVERGLSVENLCEIVDLAGQIPAAFQTIKDLVRNIELGGIALEALQRLFKYLEFWGGDLSRIKFNPTLARGLDYYTGPVFEVRIKDSDMGSVGGGGRYDGLVGMFSSGDMPAVGFAFGLERIIDILAVNELNALTLLGTEVQIILLEDSDRYVTLAGKILGYLRSEDISAELGAFPGGKVGRQIAAASKRGSRFIIIIGSNEVESYNRNQADDEIRITAKRLSDGEQRVLNLKDLKAWIT